MTAMRIDVCLDRQRLDLIDAAGTIVKDYPVSTAKNGPGELNGSECTPRGLHVVRAKIGAGCAPDTVFVRRRPTGETWTPALAAAHPGRDWMLTRILWLSGRELGFNRGGNVDSLRRKIYIHGTGEDTMLGVPGSHGCIRMKNADVIELFDRVPIGTGVDIVEASGAPFYVRVARWDDSRETLRRIRHNVFVVEQRVPPDLEWDGRDAGCRHVIASGRNGQPIGCGRLLPDGHIGRIAVLAAWRGRGVGSAMLSRLVDLARYAGFARVALNAQTHALGFYARHGFAPAGEEFEEAGIPHRAMERALAQLKAHPGPNSNA
jgi:predicted GNAT family N-acyltransferase